MINAFRFAAGLGMVLSLGLSACAPMDGADADDDSVEAVTGGAPMYVRIRPDLRRCIAPTCGGAWVSRVNQRTLRCHDGSLATECYVASVDWAGLGLTDTALDEFRSHASILRGRLLPRDYGTRGTYGELVVVEGWRAATDAAPTGVVYQSFNTARVCVRAPCPTIDADKLNGTTHLTLTGLDLAGVAGASRADVRQANADFASSPGILVAGTVATAGDARTLAASQFYLRVSPGVADASFCTADADCTVATRTRDVTTAADCYCALCPTTPMNVSTSQRIDRDYNRVCRTFREGCPVARCIAPPPVACVNHACTAAPRTGG